MGASCTTPIQDPCPEMHKQGPQVLSHPKELKMSAAFLGQGLECKGTLTLRRHMQAPRHTYVCLLCQKPGFPSSQSCTRGNPTLSVLQTLPPDVPQTNQVMCATCLAQACKKHGLGGPAPPPPLPQSLPGSPVYAPFLLPCSPCGGREWFLFLNVKGPDLRGMQLCSSV